VYQAIDGNSLLERIKGIVTLKDPTYEEIEHDQSAMTQAAVVVVAAGLATGIGTIDDRWYAIIVQPVATILAWLIGAFFIYFVGTRLIPSAQTEADYGQVLRLTGFAMITGVANLINFIPVLGPLVAFVAAILGIVIIVKAIMHALEMSVLRAIATGICAGIVEAIVIGIIGAIFGLSYMAF